MTLFLNACSEDKGNKESAGAVKNHVQSSHFIKMEVKVLALTNF